MGGFALGLIPAIVLLKRGIVDCEGWDFFHVWSGELRRLSRGSASAAIAEVTAVQKPERDQQLLADAKAQLAEYLRNRNVNAAHAAL